MRSQRASAPNKPFFVYYAPGATHSPHQVWPEWIEGFTGTFDEGWDRLREDIHARQIQLGVIPAGTLLTDRPEQIPSWASYDERYRPVATRLMEVYAGFLAHTDAQVGRLIDALEDLGQWDNTLFIYITGDNGASAEGTLNGAWSCPTYQNGLPEDPEWLLEHIDDLGSARRENHYNVAWAWALDTPFQWTKQVASHFGGTRNGMALSWPSTIARGGELRSQFHHIIDIVPTILDAAGIEAPAAVNGIEQKPLEGVTMRYTFDDADAPSTRPTQYFEILGNRALYHDGWIASCFHGRLPWVRSQAVPFDAPPERWELYNIALDFSQAVDVADQFPDKLAELRALFDVECRKYDVYPLSDATVARALPENRPSLLDDVTTVTLYGGMTRLPELSTVNLKNTSFELTAHLHVPTGGAQGVVIGQGGNMAGWSLYVQDNVPSYVYNYLGREHTVITSSDPLPAGEVRLSVSFRYDGGGLGKGGDVLLRIDGRDVGVGRIERTVPYLFSMSGETLDVGATTGSPTGPYPAHFPFSGQVDQVVIDTDPQLTQEDHDQIAHGLDRGHSPLARGGSP